MEATSGGERLRWQRGWPTTSGRCASGSRCRAFNDVKTPPTFRDFVRSRTIMGELPTIGKDAALRSVPGPRPTGRRGRPRVYGKHRIDLAKRVGQRRGWSTGVFDQYGE